MLLHRRGEPDKPRRAMLRTCFHRDTLDVPRAYTYLVSRIWYTKTVDQRPAMMLHRIRHIGLALIIPVSALSAQTPADPAAAFDKREVMVSMRDGVKLHTLFYTPKNQTENLPIIFTRTPYGIAAAEG